MEYTLLQSFFNFRLFATAYLDETQTEVYFYMVLTDQINMLRKLSLTRLSNLLKVYTSYYISKALKKPVFVGAPISASIEPTTSCNLRCPECPSGLRQFSRPTGMLNLSFYKSTINQLSKHLLYLNFYFQGEPFLHPDFFEMIRYARDKKIYSATSTNAHYLNKKTAEATVKCGLDRLIISLDGTTQDVYEQYRVGGQLEKVLAGTRNIQAAKKNLKSKTPHVIFQFLVVKPNEHQIDEAKKLGEEYGVDEVKFKTAQVYNYEHGNPLLPDNPKYSRYKLQPDGRYAIKNKLLNQCWRMWQGCVITWDGKVVPCCFDKDATHTQGDLTTTSFKNIWQGAAYSSFRSRILKARSSIDICTNCTEGTKVWG